jgi:acetyl esterase/lipase
MNIRRSLIKKIVSAQFKGWSQISLEEQRARQETSIRAMHLHKDIHCQSVYAGSVEAEWIHASSANQIVILYLHGGGYVMGSVNLHREWISRLVKVTGTKCLAINYRLAPEYPFPAALEDVLIAMNWLLDQGINPNQIVIAGDSAGGGLALAALVKLRSQGQRLPSGAICISPWVDLSLSGASMQHKAAQDPILDQISLEKYAGYYAGKQARTHPLISPLYADLSGLPPLLIQVGSDEVLLDDAIRIAEKAQLDGVEVTLRIWDEMFHVFQMIPFLAETREALGQIHRFLDKQFQHRS